MDTFNFSKCHENDADVGRPVWCILSTVKQTDDRCVNFTVLQKELILSQELYFTFNKQGTSFCNPEFSAFSTFLFYVYRSVEGVLIMTSPGWGETEQGY